MASTPRQLEVLRLIAEPVLRFEPPPTIRELAELLNIRSTNGVSEHLHALARQGLLRSFGERGWWPTADGRVLVLECQQREAAQGGK